jgi:hypothetical protein
VRDDVLIMPATLDKEKGNVGGAPAVLDRPVVENKQVNLRRKREKAQGVKHGYGKSASATMEAIPGNS